MEAPSRSRDSRLSDASEPFGPFEDSRQASCLLVFDEAQLGKLAGGSKERPQETSLGLLLRSRAAKAGSGKRFSSNMLSGVGAFYDAIANFLSSMRTQISRGWTFTGWFTAALQRCGLLGIASW